MYNHPINASYHQLKPIIKLLITPILKLLDHVQTHKLLTTECMEPVITVKMVRIQGLRTSNRFMGHCINKQRELHFHAVFYDESDSKLVHVYDSRVRNKTEINTKKSLYRVVLHRKLRKSILSCITNRSCTAMIYQSLTESIFN